MQYYLLPKKKKNVWFEIIYLLVFLKNKRNNDKKLRYKYSNVQLFSWYDEEVFNNWRVSIYKKPFKHFKFILKVKWSLIARVIVIFCVNILQLNQAFLDLAWKTFCEWNTQKLLILWFFLQNFGSDERWNHLQSLL